MTVSVACEWLLGTLRVTLARLLVLLWERSTNLLTLSAIVFKQTLFTVLRVHFFSHKCTLTSRLDHHPLSGKGARAALPNSSRGGK